MAGQVSDRAQEHALLAVHAVLAPGRSPATHARELRRLRREWPVLARQLAALCDAVAGQRPVEWRGL